MATQKKVYIAETQGTLTARRSDVTKLKAALQKVFSEYRGLKAKQRSFEVALGELCAITTRWSIPRRELTELKRMLR
jgi:hypothetical protein